MKRVQIVLGLIVAMAVGACSPDAPKLVPLKVKTFEKVEDQSDSHQTFEAAVDILFVVDNSGSMASHQNNLASNIDQFIKAFSQNQFLDYHIGVVTTDMASGLDCCGRLIGKQALYVEKATPDGMQRLAENLKVGDQGSATERSFDPAILALGNLANTYNKGFFRKNAFLAVVFITDAEDQSEPMTPKEFYDQLVQLKGMPEKVLAYGAIIPVKYGSVPPSRCPRDPGPPPYRIEEFLSLVPNAANGDNILDLCASDYGKRLGEIGKDLVKRVGNKIFLDRAPVRNTIVVKYGSFVLPSDPRKGWSYDAALNAIVLGYEVDWPKNEPPGTKVSVSYTAAELIPDKKR